MTKFFVDTNVVIDLLMARPPFHVEAAEIFDLAAGKKIQLFVSALSFTNIHYVVSKIVGPEAAIQRLSRLSLLTTVLDVTSNVIEQALISNSRDFEDAVQYHTALTESGLTGIITRDKKGFVNSSLPVLTPTEALKRL